jgi:hypothetical protein
MADTITPISNLSQIGMIKDHPPVSLPPNAFTDAMNVRFRHGAIYKMSGEKQIDRLTPAQLGVPDGEFIFITEWANPNLGDTNTFYIMVIRDSLTGTDHIIMVYALPLDLTNPEYNEIGTTTNLGTWQTTTFQGGFALILNNGLDVPFYLLDTEAGTAFADFELKQLPNWDSYFSAEELLNVVRDFKETGDPDTGPVLSLGQLIDFTTHKLLVQTFQTDGTLRGEIEVIANGTYSHGGQTALYVTTDTTTNTTTCTPEYDGGASHSAIDDGENFIVYKQSLAAVDIRANLIKSYRDILIAGDLRIIDTSDGSTIRRLPGLIRTSNIAAPGSLPTNWNPFSSGANTADEIQLSSTGIVRDMVPLQNSMVIYTDRSIHTLNLTGNSFSPFSVVNITENYGATTLDSVIEFDGRHLVVGNNDIYLFGGHPGSIQSLAEDKVRDFFFSDLNGGYLEQIYIFRNIAKDEIWIQYPSGTSETCDKSLIYNYRNQTWTVRQMSNMISGFAGRVSDVDLLDAGTASTTTFAATVSGATTSVAGAAVASTLNGGISVTRDFDATRRYPLFIDTEHVYYGEADFEFSLHEGGTYESYVVRTEMPMTPEFDVEQMNSLALWTTRYGPSNIPLYIYVQTHNNPSGDDIVVDNYQHEFTIGTDYKVDVRQTGRFFDYKITDTDMNGVGTGLEWSLSGMQARIGKRGAR